MKKLYLTFLTVIILLFGNNIYSQSHFTPVGDFTTAMSINILEAKVNGAELAAGDEIGIFDGTVCVGAFVLTQPLLSWNDAKIAASKVGADDGDTPAKDGYVVGHAITYKIYDTSEKEEITLVTPTYYNLNDGSTISPAPTFDPDVTAFVSLIATHNYTPKANAGPDQQLDENTPGQLDGSASSDLDGTPLTFTWTDIDGLSLSATNVDKPAFTAPMVNADKQFRIKLVVSDGVNTSKPDTVIVTVKQVPLPPVANAGADFQVDEGAAGQLDASASSDPDGLAYSFSWVIEPADIVLDNDTVAKPNFTAPMVTADKEYLAILTVTNSVPLSDKDTVIIKVINHNIKPVANAGTDVEKDEGVNVVLDGSASSDPDNAPNPVLTYTWSSLNGISLTGSATVAPSFTTPFLLKDSLLRFVLVVNDGDLNSNPDTVIVKVKHKNLLPTANAGTDFSADENTLVQLDGSGSVDLDGTITYKWTATGITITGDNTVKPTFTAPEVQADSVITFTLTVTDNNLETNVDAVDVTIKQVNKMPVANAGTDQEVDENVLVTLDGSLSYDPDLYDVITYKWVAPAGITLDDVTAQKPTFTSQVITEDYIDYIFKLVVNDGKIDSDTDKVVVRIIHFNIPPVANAGTDFSIDENVNGNLDGSGSYDPEGKPLTYNWIAPVGFVISDTKIANPSFDPPQVEADTEFIVVLKVNDGVRTSAPDTVKIIVKQVNKAPVANAGPDQSVDENVLVQLNGTASYDMDALDVITYLWTSLDGAVLDDNTSVTPTFTTPWLMKDSTFRFNLVVNDGKVNSEPDLVSVKVNHANLQPTADAGADNIVMNEGVVLPLNGSASSDPEGNPLTFLWSSVPAGLVIANPDLAVTSFNAPEVEQDTDYKIVLTVDDGQSKLNTDTDTILVKVVQVNKAPVAIAGADITIREQKLVVLNGIASYDPDKLDVITYQWNAPAGITLTDPTTPIPSFTSPHVTVDTDLSFELVVTDKSMAVGNDVVIVKVTPNRNPVANAGPTQNVRIKDKVTLHGENSSDPDGDVITYSWTGPVEITLVNPTSANPTFVAPESDVDKTYTFTLEVKDDLGLTDTQSVDVNVNSNLPPVIVTDPVVYVFEGTNVSLDATATYDPDGDYIFFKWFHGDLDFVGEVILEDSSTPIVSFVAPMVDKLTYMPLVLKVTDGKDDAFQLIKVYVKDILNTAPVANAGNDFSVNEGQTGQLDGSASSDIEGKPITYLWTSDFLVLDDATLVNPSFTAPEVKADTTVLVTLTVNDGVSGSDPDSVMVTIKNVNKKPVAKAGTDITVNEGEMFTLDGSASSDPDNDPLTFNWTVSGITLPGNDFVTMTLKAPQVEKDWTIPAVLVVNDGKTNSAPDTVMIKIKQVNQAPVWVEIPSEPANVGYGYSSSIKVSDPDKLDVISISSDDLPDWLTLTDNGDGTAKLESEMIPRDESLIGTHSFVLKASDGTVTIETTVELTVTVGTGITDLVLNAVKFYPNPTTGVLNVDFNSMPENSTKIQVYNQLGQLVRTMENVYQSNQLNLSGNPSGLYYIKVITLTQSRTEKVILR